MKPCSRSTILFLILITCVVFSILSAETSIAGEHDHDCTGEGCPVCAHIEAVQCFLKTFKLAVVFAFFAVCYAFFFRTLRMYNHFSCYVLTPIGLKVRFNS